MALSFSATGRKVLHSEGLVIRFSPPGHPIWTGNFEPSFGTLTDVFNHPDGRHIVVVSGGQAYVVDPVSASVSECFGADLCAAAMSAEAHVLALASLTAVDVMTASEHWRSPRVSWDGINNLRVERERVLGEGWDPLNEKWHAFAIDLVTRELHGGAYPRELG
jgi:hypothetical protein